MRRLAALLLACAACAVVDVAQARAKSATLVVTRGVGAEDCPNADGLAQRLRAVGTGSELQTDLQQPTDTWVYLEVTHDLGRYTAFLQTHGRQQGSRTLSDVSGNCASLADAVAVTLALLLDPGEPSPTPFPVRERSEPRPSPIPNPRRRRYAFTLGGGIGLRLLAEAASWGALGAETEIGSQLRIGIGGATVLPQRVEYLQGYTQLGLSWGYARVCAVAIRSRSGLELSLCASPMLGALSGSGKRYDFSARKRWLWAALAGGPQLSGPFASPAFWWIAVEGIAPLTLRGFAITIDGERHDTFLVKSVAGAASLGMGVRF